MTRTSLLWYITGTLIGLCVAVAVSDVVTRLHITTPADVAISVAICAAVAREYPPVRVCMWTVPIALLTGDPAAPIVTVALQRGAEVILGALIGGAFHTSAELLVSGLERVYSASAARR